MTRITSCPAPAKLNLFLHVIGRRADGYHLLQSAFRLIDLHDELDFERRDDGRIERLTPLDGVRPEDDLVVRAARLLQRETATNQGASIGLRKRIPMGGGLGGGSSNAATTLIALNRLWQTGLTRDQLARLGLSLGADVPFFIFGKDAFAEGVGDLLTPLTLPTSGYVVVHPGISVPTAKIFSSEHLTRDSEPIRITDFASDATRNDLQAAACKLFPEVANAVAWLEQFAPAIMTGSGACVFAEVNDHDTAARIVEQCPAPWRAWLVRSISQHPLHDWLA